MSSGKSYALQMCPFSPAMEAELARRLELIRWFELEEEERSKCLAKRAQAICVLVTGGHIGCPNSLIERLPKLGLIAINGAGFDKVDLAFCKSRGVSVTNTPDVATDDVADLAVGLVISTMRRIPAGDAHVRSGAWPHGELPLARKVSGSRFGILGLGRIGQAIANRLDVFGEVGYSSPRTKVSRYRLFEAPDQLARWCDVLVVSCAATPETRALVGPGVLDALGERGFLVNVSRGSVVDEEALIEALERGAIAGAALDVYADEPHVPIALRNSNRTVLTPHIASATIETRTAMAAVVMSNIDAFLTGDGLLSEVT
jgi:lactate dehydrogenase-like 2-hydroxyacid dehydrogenase